MIANPFEVLNSRLANIESLLLDLKHPEARQAENDLVDITEASRILNNKVSTIYVKCHRNELPHFKKGGKLYFSKKALLDFITSGKRLTGMELQATLDTQFSKK